MRKMPTAAAAAMKAHFEANFSVILAADSHERQGEFES